MRDLVAPVLLLLGVGLDALPGLRLVLPELPLVVLPVDGPHDVVEDPDPPSRATRRGSDSSAAGVAIFESLLRIRFRTPRGDSPALCIMLRAYFGGLCSESPTRGNVLTAPAPQTRRTRKSPDRALSGQG